MDERDEQFPQPLISIVIVNRGDVGVAMTLDALSEATQDRPCEVIVVDASGSQFDAVRESRPDVTWIDYPTSAPKIRTIAQQRNVGVRASRGKVIAFIDASCVPLAGWLDSLTQPVLRGEARIVAGVARSITGATIHDAPARRGPIEEFSALNVAIDRSLFDEIGLFDEQLGFAEDVDFAWRAADAGTAMIVEPAAVVRHDFGSDRLERRRAFRYGRGRARLYHKHPERVARIPTKDRQVIMVVTLWLAVLACPVAPWALIVFAYPLVKLRHRRPLQSTAYLLYYGAGLIRESFRFVR